jgi:hypothetical protein
MFCPLHLPKPFAGRNQTIYNDALLVTWFLRFCQKKKTCFLRNLAMGVE